ncbi:OadG family protein [Alteromonas halophila]|uniref:Probable oxaloacetate decarboxylase gamma chain n=1 Tax=Alteromonas halophila TaxID=516698 RepID=A0A918JEH4_9ALTE|nr:OadG family transporter subunit [Alteromonas halophila]GGW73914.1 putative oxaloacetate decarboxylase gamma chain [Alteromonas halophila]
MDANAVTSLLAEAGTLMIVGMVFVFTFLTLLIGGIDVIARFCRRFPGEQESLDTPDIAAPRPQRNENEHDPRIIAAISAAVQTHRKSRQRRLTKE